MDAAIDTHSQQFELNEDQRAIQEMAQAFAADRVAPYALEWDKAKHFPADVIRVGMCVIDCPKPPAVCVQYLAHFSPRFLVVAAVDQANVVPIQFNQPDLRRALDKIAAICDLVQFVHGLILLLSLRV